MTPEACLEQAFPFLVAGGCRLVGGLRSRCSLSASLVSVDRIQRYRCSASFWAPVPPPSFRSCFALRAACACSGPSSPSAFLSGSSISCFGPTYEVVLRTDVPDLFAGDIILFLHIVPFMAALAIRPHVPRDEYAARVGRLDFALLLTWWFYLYVLIVIPWQYVVADVAAYNRHLNAVYSAEEVAFLLGLCACWITSKGEWRKLYAGLFGMSFCYASSSTVAELGHRSQGVLQRQPLRHSHGCRHGMADLDRPADKRREARLPMPARSPRSTAYGSPAAA